MSVSDPNQQPSSYEPGQSLHQAALQALAGVLAQLNEGTAEHYGKDIYRAVQYVIAGGGPGVTVTFLLDSAGDVREATLSYQEWKGSACVPVPEWALEKLLSSFKRYQD
jgi:hypothetical protein